MRKHSLLYLTFGLVVVLGALHLIAEAFYFYWTIWWFDNVTHFLGGLTGGFAAIWFLFDSGLFYKRFPTIFGSIFAAVTSVIVAAVVWEIFEYANDLAVAIEDYAPDTFHDILFGILGAVLAGVFGVGRSFHLKN